MWKSIALNCTIFSSYQDWGLICCYTSYYVPCFHRFLLISLFVINWVRIWLSINKEGNFPTNFSFVSSALELIYCNTVLPSVNIIFRANYNMSFWHGNRTRFNVYPFTIHWWAYSIAKHQNICIFLFIYLWNQKAIILKCSNLPQILYVLFLSLTCFSIIEYHTKIDSILFLVPEHNRICHIASFVIWLDISKKYWRSKSND